MSRQYDQPKQRDGEKRNDQYHNKNNDRTSQQQDKNSRQTYHVRNQQQERQHYSKIYSDQNPRIDQHNKEHQRDENKGRKDIRVPERYGREEMGKDAHKRDTSRDSRNSYNQDQGISAKFYNNWQAQNNMQSSSSNNNKRAHNQDRAQTAKRSHTEIQSNNNKPIPSHLKATHNANKVNEPENKKTKSSIVITNKQNTTPLDLNISRRSLSPVHNLNPKKLSTTKNNQPSKINNFTRQANNKSETKEKIIPTETNGSAIDSHRDSDNFDNINESDLPCIGDITSLNST